MSTDQPTLSESIDRQAERTRQRASEQLAGQGAVYGRQGDAAAVDSDPVPKCLGCDRDLVDVAGSPQHAREIARVVGDNDGHVPGCPECVEHRDYGRTISSVASAAALARQRGERRP